MKRAVVLIGIVLAVLDFSQFAIAQSGPVVGPMTVSRFRILEKAAASDKWAAVAFQEYINGLLEGIFDREGEVFCLPQQTKSGTVNDVFRRVTVDVVAAVRQAKTDEYVRNAVLNNFRKTFRC